MKAIRKFIILGMVLGLSLACFRLSAGDVLSAPAPTPTPTPAPSPIEASAPSSMFSGYAKREQIVNLLRFQVTGTHGTQQIRKVRFNINSLGGGVTSSDFDWTRIYVSSDANFDTGDTLLDTINPVHVSSVNEFTFNYAIGNNTKWFIIRLKTSASIKNTDTVGSTAGSGTAFDATMPSGAIDSSGTGGAVGKPAMTALTSGSASDIYAQSTVQFLNQPSSMVSGARAAKNQEIPVIAWQSKGDSANNTIDNVRIRVNQQGGNVTASDFTAYRIYASSDTSYSPSELVNSVTPVVGSNINLDPNFTGRADLLGGTAWFIVTVVTSGTIADGDMFDVTMPANGVDSGGYGGGAGWPTCSGITSAAAPDITIATTFRTDCPGGGTTYSAFGANQACDSADFKAASSGSFVPRDYQFTSGAPAGTFAFSAPNPASNVQATAAKCIADAPITSTFQTLPITGTNAGTVSNLVTNWTPLTATACVTETPTNPADDVSYTYDYRPVIGNKTCNLQAGTQIGSFAVNKNIDIANSSVNILNSGNFLHCDSDTPMKDPEYEIHTNDDRRFTGGLTKMTARTCTEATGRWKNDTYSFTGTNTYTCNARDYDVDGGYDALRYAFKLKAREQAAYTTCGTTWTAVQSGAITSRCMQGSGANANQIYFETNDSAGTYDVECITQDQAADGSFNYGNGSNDLAHTVLTNSAAVGCNIQGAVGCPGESVDITLDDILPNSGTAGLSGTWSCPDCSDGAQTRNWTTNVSPNPYQIDLVTGDEGATRTAQLQATYSGNTATCTSQVKVLRTGCGIRVVWVHDPSGAVISLSEIVPGSTARFRVDTTCLDSILNGQYTFEVARSGGGTQAADCSMGAGLNNCGTVTQGSSTLDIVFNASGAFTVNGRAGLTTGGDENCNGINLLINTLASEWWENRP